MDQHLFKRNRAPETKQPESYYLIKFYERPRTICTNWRSPVSRPLVECTVLFMEITSLH